MTRSLRRAPPPRAASVARHGPWSRRGRRRSQRGWRDSAAFRQAWWNSGSELRVGWVRKCAGGSIARRGAGGAKLTFDSAAFFTMLTFAWKSCSFCCTSSWLHALLPQAYAAAARILGVGFCCFPQAATCHWLTPGLFTVTKEQDLFVLPVSGCRRGSACARRLAPAGPPSDLVVPSPRSALAHRAEEP